MEISGNNASFVLRGIEDVGFEQRPVPEISGHEVLVQVKKTGICGSDIHYYTHGRIGDFVVKSPMVLGHESSGVIVRVGDKVRSLKVGDRVAVEPGATCRMCDYCKRGRYELCPDIVFAATPPYDGTLSKYYRVPADLAYALPDNVSLEDGALMEPLSVGIHSVSNLGGFRANQNIVVFGCGPVGLLAMAVAKALGSCFIIAVDIQPARLEFAKSYAATHCFFPPPRLSDEPNISYSKRCAIEMKQTFGIEPHGPKAVDLVIDASGADTSIQTALHLLRAGGTLVQVGMGNPEVALDVGQIITKELHIKGSFRYGPGDYALAIGLVSQGKINLRPLVTHRYPFDQAVAAFSDTSVGKGKDGRPLIKAMISGPGVGIDEV